MVCFELWLMARRCCRKRKLHKRRLMVLFSASNCHENIEFVLDQGLEVDYDSEPTPKNIPEADAQVDNLDLFAVQTWSYDGVDARAVTKVTD